jgi:CheY-specific phosphatase CheX
MGIQFFGEFLIDRWVVTRGQLIEALELQEYRNLKLGALAVRKGYLTEDQASQINELQKSQDMRFGDLVVARGLMTEAQVQELLAIQKNNYLYLGEALIELGYLTEDILERELAIFKEEQAPYRLDEVSVPAGTKSAETVRASVDLTRKMFVRVVGLMVKVGEGRQDDGSKPLESEYHLSVAIPFFGSQKASYILSVSSEVAVMIASRILKEDATRESEDIVEDAVREFCNIVCGNAAAKLSQMGVQVEIGPPETLATTPKPIEGMTLLVFPIHIAEGGVDLRFMVPIA